MQQYFAKSKDNDILYLNSDDMNHIKNVMRMKENTEIIVVYDDKSYICNLNKDLLSARIDRIFKDNEKNTNFVCYMPLLSEDKMGEILKHGTELGYTEFVIVQYSHCKYKLKKNDYKKKLIRWNRIVKEASEQCYRINKPNIQSIIDVDSIDDKSNVKILCSLDKNNVKHISEVLTSNNKNDTISIAFGPEGGLSENEEKILVDKGFVKTSLCDNVLRSETVPLYIASVRLYVKGE